MSAKENIEEVFQNIDIPIDCKFLIAQVNGKIIQFIEVYRIHSTFSLKLNKVGNWTDSDGILFLNNLNYKERSNLEGLKLRIAGSTVRFIYFYLYLLCK